MAEERVWKIAVGHNVGSRKSASWAEGPDTQGAVVKVVPSSLLTAERERREQAEQCVEDKIRLAKSLERLVEQAEAEAERLREAINDYIAALRRAHLLSEFDPYLENLLLALTHPAHRGRRPPEELPDPDGTNQLPVPREFTADQGDDMAEWPVPELTDVDMAFPANALDWMPPMDDIPDEFKDDLLRGTEWNKIANAWFIHGLPADVRFYPKDRIDPSQAVNALNATLSSYAPKHEHKLAAVAYMMSCWFRKVEKWEGGYDGGK